MGSQNALVPAYVLSVVAVLAAALGSLVIIETATVKVSVPTSTLTANLTINGGQSGHGLATTRIEADVSDTMQGTASTDLVPPAYATGQVRFHLTCPAISPCNPVTLKAGTVVATAKGFRYLTGAQVVLQQAGQDVSVGIRATVAGAAGNTAPNTVTIIESSPSPNVSVVNLLAITGGADASTGQVILQSDFDRVRSALTAQAMQDLDSALRAQAEGLVFAPDGQPSLNLTSDHKVGDRVATFTMTITASLGAIAFSEGAADALMRAALDQKIPKGFELTAAPIQTHYQVQKSSANGDVTIKGSAVGVIVPNVTASELKTRIRGLRVDAARRQLEKLAPGTTVDISVRPAVPWLPVLQDHISLTIELESTTVSPAV